MKSTYLTFFKTNLGPLQLLSKLFGKKCKHQFVYCIQIKRGRGLLESYEDAHRVKGKAKDPGTERFRWRHPPDNLNCFIWTLVLEGRVSSHCAKDSNFSEETPGLD